MRKPREVAASKHVGIWIRVSTEDQVKGESPERHEHRARSYADAKGWKVREVYHLEAVSGKSVMGHSEAQRMLDHVRAGHITGLIFSKLARLARNTRELLDFADIFREHDADLISIGESIDTSTPAGRLFYTMIAAMAQWEREEISERIAASVPVRARMGKRISGAAPFGYAWQDHTLQPDSKEAPVRRLMYELFLEHRRIKTVARVLNERGFRTRNGSEFSGTTVQRLIEDPTAKGIRRANWTRSTGDGKHWVQKPEEDWVTHPIPAIVTEETWDAANAILTGRKENGKPAAKRAVYLFSGLAVCHCGQKMYVPSWSTKYVCRACKNRIGIEDLEVIFQDQLKDFFLDPEEVGSYLEESDEVLRSKAEALGVLETERDRVRAEMDKVYRAYVADEISMQAFGAMNRPLEERSRQIEDELPRLQGEVDFLKIDALSRDEVLSGARDLASRWPDLEFEEKRQIVEHVVKEVLVGKDDVDIHLIYLPQSPSEITAQRSRIHIPALPFCGRHLRAPKPIDPAYPTELLSLGDHVRKRRLDLGLLQREVAQQIGVDATTVFHWETGVTTPRLRIVPGVIRFLGYDPSAPGESIVEQLRAERLRRGWSQADIARRLGVDPATISKWELRGEIPWPRHRDIVARFLGS